MGWAPTAALCHGHPLADLLVQHLESGNGHGSWLHPCPREPWRSSAGKARQDKARQGKTNILCAVKKSWAEEDSGGYWCIRLWNELCSFLQPLMTETVSGQWINNLRKRWASVGTIIDIPADILPSESTSRGAREGRAGLPEQGSEKMPDWHLPAGFLPTVATLKIHPCFLYGLYRELAVAECWWHWRAAGHAVKYHQGLKSNISSIPWVLYISFLGPAGVSLEVGWAHPFHPIIGGNHTIKDWLKHDVFHRELQMMFSLGRAGTVSSHQYFYESIFLIADEKSSH